MHMLLLILRPWTIVRPILPFAFIHWCKIWVLIVNELLLVCIRRHLVFFICWDEVISWIWLFEWGSSVRMSWFWVRLSLLISRVWILILCGYRVLSRNEMVSVLSASVPILNCDPVKDFVHIILKKLLVRITLLDALRSQNTFLIYHVKIFLSVRCTKSGFLSSCTTLLLLH